MAVTERLKIKSIKLREDQCLFIERQKINISEYVRKWIDDHWKELITHQINKNNENLKELEEWKKRIRLQQPQKPSQ